MNRFLYIVVTLLFLASCQEQEEPRIKSIHASEVKSDIVSDQKVENTSHLDSTQWLSFQGRSGEYNQLFIIELGIEGSAVSGSYFHPYNQKVGALTGTIDSLDTIRVSESFNGELTGTITCHIDSLGINGKWTKQTTGISSMFTASQLPHDSLNNEPIKVDFEKYIRPHKVLEYPIMNQEPIAQDAEDRIMISMIDSSLIAFDYVVVGNNARVGSIEGVAQIKHPDFAVYETSQGCQLVFLLTQDNITIKQTGDCSGFGPNGMRFDNFLERYDPTE